MTTLLTLTGVDFRQLLKAVTYKCNDTDYDTHGYGKSIIIPTPSAGFNLIFTKAEADEFLQILEEADSEVKVQQLLKLFEE